MSNTSWLAKILKWMFAIFAVGSALGAVAFAGLWAVCPQLPPDASFGPYRIVVLDQLGSVALNGSTFSLTALHGNLDLRVNQAGGLIAVLEHYGLPVLVLKAAFFATLFWLLFRLFRNVARRESFTQQTVRLVQTIGVALIVFSLVFAAAESWFFHAAYAYVAQHATLQISGTPLRLPHGSQSVTISSGGFPFGTPIFFSGLLVLALSEVFRQGLALKSENDLTV